MNELALIFGGKKWKDKYWVDWCDQCECAVISCEKCSGTTCNCHSCDDCDFDFREFDKYNTRVEHYLTQKEIKIYHKCLKIKDLMLKTIPNGEKIINFKKLQLAGELSENDEKMFAKELELS